MDPLHPCSILSRQSRNGTHCIYSVHGHGLNVRLNTCAAAAVTSRDR